MNCTTRIQTAPARHPVCILCVILDQSQNFGHMGYMGFGMRKEDYKRKPKESFKKIKERYGNDTPKPKHDPNSPQLTREEVLNKPRFKSIHDMRFFQLLKLTVLIGFVGFFLYLSLIKPYIIQWRLENFHQLLIEQYSSDHDYILASGDLLPPMLSFSFDSLSNTTLVVSKNMSFLGSAYYQQGPEFVIIGTRFANALDFSFDGERLQAVREDSVQVLENKWVIAIVADSIDFKCHKLLGHLLVDVSYIDELTSRLKKVKLKEISRKNGQTILGSLKSKKYGSYEFVRTSKALRESKYQMKIDDRTYLRKRD